MRSKYDARFSGVMFLVNHGDTRAGIAALACRLDDDYDEQVINVLSRKYSPIFWVGNTLPEDVLRFMKASPIRAVISLAKLDQNCMAALRELGFVIVEIDPGRRFLARAVQQAVDALVGIERRSQVVTVAPPLPDYMLLTALTSSAHGYQWLADEPGLLDEFAAIGPAAVALCNAKGTPAGADYAGWLKARGIRCETFSEDSESVSEGTTNSLVTFGTAANLGLDQLLEPTLADTKALSGLSKTRNKRTAPEHEYFAANPYENAPLLLVITTYDPTRMDVAISAANYAKSKNAIFLLLPAFSDDVKNRVISVLRALGGFISEENASRWRELWRLMCQKAVATGEDLRGSFFTGSRNSPQPASTGFASLRSAKEWLTRYHPHDLVDINSGRLDLESLDSMIAKASDSYRRGLPSEVRKRLPNWAIIPFDSAVTELLHRIGKDLMTHIPESLLLTFVATPKNYILYFPTDPTVPLEFMTTPETPHALGTLHSLYAFGRVPSNWPNDASFQCGYGILHSSTSPGVMTGVAVADPTCDLGSSEAEMSALKRSAQMKWTSLVGRRATKDAVVKSMRTARFVYFSCHGSWDARGRPNLRMHDGGLYGSALPEMLGRPFVLANACMSGADSGYLATGSLALEFISKGAVAYVGSLWAIESVSAAFAGMHIMDSIMEVPVGSALRAARHPGILGDFTRLAYILYGDPTLPVFEPLLYAGEAYYYSQLSESLMRMGANEFAADVNRKSAARFETMEVEFGERCSRDRKRSGMWKRAAENARFHVLQLDVDYHIAKHNAAKTASQRDDEMNSAISALRLGLRRFSKDPWFRARLSALLGTRSLMRGTELVEHTRGGIEVDKAVSEFRCAVGRFERAIRVEPGDFNATVFSASLNEARGFLNLCLGMKGLRRHRAAYDRLLKSAMYFQEGSAACPEKEIQRRLQELRRLPLHLLIEWDESMLTELTSRLESGKIEREKYQEAAEAIRTRLHMYRSLSEPKKGDIADADED